MKKIKKKLWLVSYRKEKLKRFQNFSRISKFLSKNANAIFQILNLFYLSLNDCKGKNIETVKRKFKKINSDKNLGYNDIFL